MPHPKPASESPVFIIGSGRCGSTVLQQLLNAHPDFRIWGEHGGFLRHLADAYYFRDSPEAIERIGEWTGDAPPETRARRLRDPKRWTGWDNAFTLNEWSERYRQFVRSFFNIATLDRLRWGFKEIRYGWAGDRSMDMLLELFPDARFLIVVRHPTDTVFSMVASWRRDLDRRPSDLDDALVSLADGWREQYHSYLAFQKTAPASCLCCRYEDLKAAGFLSRLEAFLEVREPFAASCLNRRNQDACEKNDSFARLIRERMEAIRPRLEEITASTQVQYGYSAGWAFHQLAKA